MRHEKLVHLNEGSKENTRPRKLSSSTSTTSHKPSLSSESQGDTDIIGLHRTPGRQNLPPPTAQHSHHQPHYHHVAVPPVGAPGLPPPQDPRATPRTAACNLDLLSDAALASAVNPGQPMATDIPQHVPHHERNKSFAESAGSYPERPREDSQPLIPSFGPQPTQGIYDDYNLFLDDFSSSSHFLPPHFEPDQQMNSWSRGPGSLPPRGSVRFPPHFSTRHGSDCRDPSDSTSRMHEDPSRSPSLRISVVDHTVIKNRLDEFSSVLPNDFVFPSRHTLTRFLEGYMSGFHEHLPFLHLPTFTPTEIAPELLLAILAVGAQYRFENNRGYALWYAAKAVALEQTRRRHSSEVHALLPTPAAYSPHSTRPSPNTTYRHSFASAQSERPTTQDTHREP